MSSSEQALVEPQPDIQPTEQSQSSDLANSSSDSDWGLLGNLMIDLNPVNDQSPLKMQNGSVENRAPKPEPEKSLKMKIKRKSKTEEKHEIVTPEMDKLKVGSPKAKQKPNKEKKSIKPEGESGEDPYSFKNADDETNSGPSAKKPRVDKPDNSKKKAKKDASINTSSVSTIIEPDSLGPCEPGTNISLDGIVWLETATGLLVVNVTWRGRTYVGTLLDATQHDFAPPCPKDYVPPMEAPRNQRGRGKRRGGGSTNSGQRGRRIGRQLPLSSKSDESDDGSRASELKERTQQPSIKCPQPGCCKRFQDLQALKWHSLEKHSVKPFAPATYFNGFTKEETEDGSSVFKVPHAKHAQTVSVSGLKLSPAKTVTVTKTCSVPSAGCSSAECKNAANSNDANLSPTSLSQSKKEAVPPFKAIQPRPKPTPEAIANGAAPLDLADLKKKGKKRNPSLSQQQAGYQQPPTLAPKSTSSPSKKGIRKSDPVSPAYSDISDEGAPAPVLEKEEPEPPAKEASSSAAMSVPKPSNLPYSTAPTTSTVASAPSVQPPPAHTPRGSPNAPSKPSLGHSPSERPETVVTAKHSDERRQILAENSDIKEPAGSSSQPSPRSSSSQPSAHSRPSESPRRPSSRPQMPLPVPFLPPPPSVTSSPGSFHPPPLDYRMFPSHAPNGPLGPAAFMSPGYPFPDKAALEALGHYASAAANRPFMMPHKIHELVSSGRSSSPTLPGRKTPPSMAHHMTPFPRVDPFPMQPPFSSASAMLHHPGAPHFLPPK